MSVPKSNNSIFYFMLTIWRTMWNQICLLIKKGSNDFIKCRIF